MPSWWWVDWCKTTIATVKSVLDDSSWLAPITDTLHSLCQVSNNIINSSNWSGTVADVILLAYLTN